MNVTKNLKLPQYTEEDIFDLQDINKAYSNIDNAYKEVIDFKNEIPKTNATAEVINARGGKETLGKRLDEFGSQLDKCAKESEVVKKGQVDLDEMTERTLQAIEKGQGTTFNLLSIPRDNSVTLKKISNIILPTNKNLLDDITIEEGKQLNPTGGTTTFQADDKFTTDFIEVSANTDYIFTSLTGTVKYALRIALYDSSKTYIDKIDNVDTFTTTDVTNYVKITAYIDQTNDMIFQTGSQRVEIERALFKGIKTEGEDEIKAELEKIKTNGLLTETIIDCWGDSLTAGSGADETHKYPYVLAQLTGLTVNQFGVGGETTATIASRQGGMPMVINNITIPKSGSVAINELKNLDGTKVLPCLQHGARGINPCFINDIEGTLSYNSTNSNWEFTRATSGNEISINRPTIIKTNAMINNRNNIMIIWAGTNDNTTDATNIIRLEKLMIDYSKCKDYLILSPPTGSKTSMANMEKQFLEAFGNRYINTREYLCTYGMEDAGLTPSESDLTDMANGIIPMSLKIDPTHGNNYYYPIIANLVYKRLKELNII